MALHRAPKVVKSLGAGAPLWISRFSANAALSKASGAHRFKKNISKRFVKSAYEQGKKGDL
jgi:hypothetical protein